MASTEAVSAHTEGKKTETAHTVDKETQTEEVKKEKKSIASRIFAFKCLQPARDEEGTPIRLRAPSKRKEKKSAKKSKHIEEEREEVKDGHDAKNGDLPGAEEGKGTVAPQNKEEEVKLEMTGSLKAQPKTLLATAEVKQAVKESEPLKEMVIKPEAHVEFKKEGKDTQDKKPAQETKKEVEKKEAVRGVTTTKLETGLWKEARKEESKEIKKEVVTKVTEVKMTQQVKINDTAVHVQNFASKTVEVSGETFLAEFHQKYPLHPVDFLKVWKNYDKDNNGYITSTELRPFLIDLMKDKGESTEKEKVDTYFKVMMALFDKNKDGKLEMDEMARLLPVEKNYLMQFPSKKIPQEEFENIFKHYDVNNDGTVSGDELLALLKDMFQHQHQEINPKDLEEYAKVILEIYDIGGDGKLSKSDIAVLLSKSQSK